MKILIALVLVSLYALFASYQWWSAPLECDNSALAAQVATLRGQLDQTKQELATAKTQQAKKVEQGNTVVAETARDFAPLKEIVREVRVESCDGAFPDGVSDALNRAVGLATESNRQLPATKD